MQTSKQLSRVGLMIALAMIFSYLENLIPLPFLVPGVKLGLANLVILFPLYLWGIKKAAIISAMRILLVSITFGNPAMAIYSFAGATLSLAFMALAQKSKRFSPIGVSMIGGVFHNIGQIAVAILIVENLKLIILLPVLIVSGALTGFVIGGLTMQVLARVKEGTILK